MVVLLVACALAFAAAMAFAAPSAVAAPELQVTSTHTPSFFLAGETGRYEVSVRNVGDAPTDGLVTVTSTLPDGLRAVSAADPFGGAAWSCAISAAGRTVTCEGPVAFPFIPPGSETCEWAIAPCPIAIEVEVAPGLPEGEVVHQVQACGGGAASCASDDDPTAIFVAGRFGAGFGIATINEPGYQSSPAFEGDKAFWAGTCDRASAPGFGEPIPGGVGSRPATIKVPNTPEWQPLAFDVRPAPQVPPHCIDWGSVSGYPGASDFRRPWTDPPAWRLAASTQAGAHPDASATFRYAREARNGFVDGSVDNIFVELPAGFVGDPTSVPKCSAQDFSRKPLRCPPETQVGVVQLWLAASVPTDAGGAKDELLAVYNLEPRKGNTAELGFGYASLENATTVRLVAKARTNGDFGVRTFAGQIPAGLPLVGQAITVWGVPWAAHNDVWRAPTGTSEIPQQGLDGSRDPAEVETGVSARTPTPYRAGWGTVRPFISNPTECDGRQPVVDLYTDSYQDPGSFMAEGGPVVSDLNWKRAQSASPPVTGCEKVPFDADIDLQPSSTVADAPSGLAVGLSVPQSRDPETAAGDPLPAPAEGAGGAETDAYVQAATAHWASDAGLASSHLDRAVVTLPAGVSVNPSGAAGLEGCGDGGVGVTNAGSNPMLFNDGDPFNQDGGADGAECPGGSKIGTVEVDTPLLEEPLTGEVVLGMPKSTDPASGQMFRMFIVARNVERGLIAKIYGSAVADPRTGQLTATFDKNPRVPFDAMRLQLKGGDRGLLALPQRCQSSGWTSAFTPWTAAHGAGGSPVSDDGGFVTDQRCGFGFSPGMQAGMSARQGGGSGAFTFMLSRDDGEQWLGGVTAKLPAGLLAAVRDVALCSNAQAAANACPQASRIGSVDAGAGSGAPFFLERKGDVYLTEGYKGAPYGLAVSVPVEAGPFRGAMALSPIVVRQALHVDPSTAQVTAVSDPFPQIHHGIPLRVRQLVVTVDRPGFMRNATDCSPKQITASVLSTEGAVASTASGYQATGCARLAFKPKLSLRLTGRRQMRTGKHPGVRAQVTQTAGEAAIKRAQVRLPKTLALDPDNAGALCEHEAGVKPDIERHCPKGSIVGRAKAVSPLLKAPLTGNVYFVKNVRRSKSGNLIRTLPMIIVALRGEIAVNLRGESSVDRKRRLVNTFAMVPDAPISKFNLNIAGGRDGIVTVTRTQRSRIDLCSKRQIAEADIDGHNGRRRDTNPRLKTPCKTTSKKRKVTLRRSPKRDQSTRDR